MSYNIKLPDGRYVKVADDVPMEQARTMIVRQFPDLFKRPQGFGPAMSAGWDRAAEGIQTFGADVSEKLGFDSAARGLRAAAAKNRKEQEQEYDPTTSEDVDAAWGSGVTAGIGALARKYATEPAGGMVGSLGPAAIGAAAGAVSPVPGGATAGFAAPFFAQSAGENQIRQREVSPGHDPNLLTSTATAVAQTALGMFGFGKMVNGAIGSQLALREAEKLAPKVLSGALTKEAAAKQVGGTLRNVLAETGASFGINAGTGAADEALRRAQAGQSVTDAGAIDAYKDIATTAGVMAPAFGAVHGGRAKAGAVGVLDAAQRKGEGQRRLIQREQQQPAFDELEAMRAAEEAEPTAPAPANNAEEAAQRMKDLNRDAAYRAVEQRDNADPTARADAEAAFANAPIQTDLFGADRVVVPKETPRVDPEAPAAQPGQMDLLDARPHLDLEPSPADPQKPPAPPAVTPEAPRLTTAQDFADVFYPNAKSVKDGKLDGHDLNNVDDVKALRRVVKAYKLEDSERNAARNAAKDALVERLDGILAQLQAKQLELPIQQKGETHATDPAVPTVVSKPDIAPANPAAKGATNADPTVQRQAPAADPVAAFGDLGQRDQPQAVPARLPAADGRANDAGHDPVADRVRPEGGVDAPLTPLQERRAFGKAAGARVDAGGHYLYGRQNAKLGRAMEEGSFEGVVGALKSSKNPFIQKVGELAENLTGVKVKLDDDAYETYERDADISNDARVAAAYHKSVLEAVGPHADALREGKIPEKMWDIPAPWLRNIDELANEPENRLTLGTLKGAFKHNDPASILKEYEASKSWAEKNGGMPAIDRALNRKIEASGADGKFDPKLNEISAQKFKGKDEHTVAHEMVHALTHDAIDNPTREQKYFVDKLKSLHAYVKNYIKEHHGFEDGKYKTGKSWEHGQDYGMHDIHEFVSEAMTNPDFQHKLSQIKYQNTTAWGKFTDFVAKLLGLKNDNAFTEFLANFEGLSKADGGLKGGKADKAPKYLGAYNASSTPDVHRGVFGKIKDVAESAKDGSVMDRVIHGLFDNMHGVTRHLERAWTRVGADGQTEATARALLQSSNYAPQLARESLVMGFVKKNAEGYWKIARSEHNLRSMLEAIEALPTSEDKMRVANGILTNLSYHEREQMLGAQKANAKKLLAAAEKDLAAAKKLTGNKAAKAIRVAKAKKAMADDLLEKEFKRPASVTDATIAQALEDAKTPEVKKLVDTVREINRQNINMLEEGGVISKEAADLWRERDHYVPLRRIMEDDPVGRQMIGLGMGGARTKDIKTFKGSEREVDDITQNLIEQRMYVVDAAMRNNAYRKAIMELMEDPTNPAGVDRLGPKSYGGNTVSIKENGERIYYRVDDKMAMETLQGLIQDGGPLVDALENVTKFFRSAVMLSPDSIFRNLVRDTAEVWASGASGKSFAGVVANVGGQFAKSLPGVAKEGFGTKRHQPHYEVSDFGIAGHKEFTSLDAERRAIVMENLKRHGVKDWAATADGIIDAAARLLKPLENLSAEGELAPRNHVFKEALKRTGSETEAAMAAINTLDFRRRGQWRSITIAKKLIPFFNSQLQGWYKLASGFIGGDNLSSGIKDRNAARRALAGKAVKMMAAASIYQMLMQEDEDYMEVKKDIRDQNILIPAGTDDSGKTIFMKLALPHEYGSLFWTTPANLMNTLSDKQDGADFMASLSAAARRAMPGVLPQIAKPLLENTFNYSTFSGKPLENESMQRLEPGKRATDSTSELSKAVGDATNMSPVKLDNFLRGYLGTLGMLAVQGVDKLIPSDTEAADKPWHRAPVLKSLLTDPLASASRDKFYALKETVQQVRNTATAITDPDKRRAYLEESTGGVTNSTLFAMYTPMQQVGKQMQEVSKAEKAIKASGDSAEMKRARLEQLRRMMNFKLQKAMPSFKEYAEEADDEEE